VIYGILKTFNENPRTGTVGSRLHYEDGTIQHDGIFIYLKESNKKLSLIWV
jgi:hypothetical protein